MRKGKSRHTPSSWTRRAATEDRLAYRRGTFVVEAHRAELERPGLSVGSGWEVTCRRGDESAPERVVRRVTTREEAVDELFETMRRINREGGIDAVRRSGPDGSAPAGRREWGEAF